jgi:TonB family protein
MIAILADLAIRSSLVLAAGLLLSAALAKRSAALRHFVLASAVVATIAVLPLGLLMPAWHVRWPSLAPAAATVRVASPAVVAAPAAAASVTPRAVDPAPVVIAAWLAGVLVAFAALATALVRLKRLAARAAAVTSGPWVSAAVDVAGDYGLTRTVEILQTGAPGLLATYGVRRPRVLLPARSQEWPDDRIRAVMGHELAHVRRNDWCVQIAAEALKSLLWFNPLMWLACARLRRESEQACDDLVLRGGMPARDYAGHLLELARICRPSPLRASITPMSQSTLEGRVTAMLNPHLDRRPLTPRAGAAIAVLLVALVLPAASLRAGQAGPAALSGSVYDTTGGVLPGVELTLEDDNQTLSRVITNASGQFVFPTVAAGHYVLVAALPGFRTLRHAFDLQNTRDWDRAITLQVGEVNETITVRETRLAAPALGPGPRAAEPIRVGGNIRVPRKELDVKPVYPPAMRAAGREGVVPIQAVIGKDGTVTAVRVLSAQVHPDFAIAAADAVRQWRFTPTLLNGAPVEVVMTVSVAFNLD